MAMVVVMSVSLRTLLVSAIREIWHLVPEPPSMQCEGYPSATAAQVEIQRVRSAKMRLLWRHSKNVAS
jgi:hypothetical protein